MASVNKVILVGNVGRDPELKYLPSGTAACQVSIATTSTSKDKRTGEKIERTEWHRCQAFDRVAEVIGEYAKKGDALYIEGSIRYGKYTGRDGVEKSTTDIVVHGVQLLGRREAGAPRDDGSRPAAAPAPSRGGESARQPAKSSTGFDDMDDDIPF